MIFRGKSFWRVKQLKNSVGDEKLIFDITSEESSRNFLKDFLSIDDEQMSDYVETAHEGVDVDEFIERVNLDLEELDVDKILLSVLHITTSNDECRSIKEIGLLNLQQALTMETPLRNFLRDYNVQFDIYNNLMCVGDRFHEIKYDSSFYETETFKGKMNNVARKIYFDYQINGFFCVRDAKGYGGYVHLRPEIVYDLALLGKKPDEFEARWVKNNKPYVVKFNAPIEYFTHYSFYFDMDEFKEDYSEKIVLKKWLLKNALNVICDKYHFGEYPDEITAYLKPEVSIPYSYIVEINEI